MEKYLSEAAAWRYIATKIEELGHIHFGLCHEVKKLYKGGVIDGAAEATMLDRIRDKHEEVQGFDSESGYTWPIGQIAPRIAACREFAALAEVDDLYLAGQA